MLNYLRKFSLKEILTFILWGMAIQASVSAILAYFDIITITAIEQLLTAVFLLMFVFVYYIFKQEVNVIMVGAAFQAAMVGLLSKLGLIGPSPNQQLAATIFIAMILAIELLVQINKSLKN